jgi:hypothetical protein
MRLLESNFSLKLKKPQLDPGCGFLFLGHK